MRALGRGRWHDGTYYCFCGKVCRCLIAFGGDVEVRWRFLSITGTESRDGNVGKA